MKEIFDGRERTNKIREWTIQAQKEEITWETRAQLIAELLQEPVELWMPKGNYPQAEAGIRIVKEKDILSNANGE